MPDKISEDEFNKQRAALRNRWAALKLSPTLAAWEMDISKYLLYPVIDPKKYLRVETLQKVLKWTDECEQDCATIDEGDVDFLLSRPIRILHMGKLFEQALKEIGVKVLWDLVQLTPYQIANKSSLGIRRAASIQTFLGPRLKLGMKVEKRTTKMTMTIEVEGDGPDVFAAVHSINQHLSTRIDQENLSLKASSVLKSSEVIEEDTGAQNNHPFKTSIMIQCGLSRLEIRNRRFRGCKDFATLLEILARKVKPIKNVKDWEASDVWVSDMNNIQQMIRDEATQQ